MNATMNSNEIHSMTITVAHIIDENVHDFVVDMSHDAAYETIKFVAAILFIGQDYAPLFALAGFCVFISAVHVIRHLVRHAHRAAQHTASNVVRDDDADFQAFLRILNEKK